MEPAPRTAASKRLLTGLLLGAFFLGLGLMLGLQPGHMFDEAEHAHAAWLMGELGLRPMHDFFQHHQPLLWHALQIYRPLGARGPEILIVGRLLVVLCALALFAGLLVLGRRWDVENRGWLPAGTAGLGLTGGFFLLFPELFVVRPETLSTAMFIGALLCWTSTCSDALRGLASGGLFGLAVYASPRFLLLGGAFALLTRRTERAVELAPVPLTAFAAAAAATFAVYALACGQSAENIWFNLVFSVRLQSIGPGDARILGKLAVLAALSAVGLGLLAVLLRGLARRRWLVQTGYLAVLAALTFRSAGSYFYAHPFLVPALWLSLMLVYAVSQMTERLRRSADALAGGLLLVVLGTALSRQVHLLQERFTVLELMASRRQLLSIVPPGEPVLLGLNLHPIAARDASYFGPPLIDGPDRVCAAVKQMEPHWGLPRCDYLQDFLRERPVLADPVLLRILPPEQQPELRRLLAEEYRRVEPGLYLRRSPR